MSDFTIGYEIRKVAQIIKRMIAKNGFPEDLKLSPSQMEVIFFIKHKEGAIFQKDIEKEFDLTKPTVSLNLDNLIKHDLIQKVSVKGDARLKQIVLTEKALQLTTDIQNKLHKVDAAMSRDITKEELETMKVVFAKIRKNAEEFSREEN